MTNFTQERYINPYTDFGFKKLFGTEMNKDLLISFLNALFSGHEVVRDVTYLNGEHFGDSVLSAVRGTLRSTSLSVLYSAVL